MSENKFQHWVPSCYLKKFALDPSGKRINRRIFVTTSDESKDKKIVKVGGENWTYSKNNPELDLEFTAYENDYPNIVDKLISEEEITGEEKVTFIIAAFDLHHRSIAYENRTPKERFHIYEKASEAFIELIVPKDRHLECDNYLNDNWNITIISAGQSKKFITSDHPSLIFCDSNDEKPIICLLPLTPSIYAVIYKSNCFKVQEMQTEDCDTYLLNLIQAKRCIKELFSDYNLFKEKDESETIKTLLSFSRPDRYFNKEGYKPDFIKVTDRHFSDLNFISRT